MNNKNLSSLIKPAVIFSIETPISKIIPEIQTFDKNKSGMVCLTDLNEKFEGTIRPKDLLGKMIQLSTPARSFLFRNIPTIMIDNMNDLDSLCDLFQQADIHDLPVLDKYNKILGVVQEIPLLNEILEKNSSFSEFLIRDIIQKRAPLYLNPNDTLGTAIALFRDNNVNQIPVYENKINEISGIVDIRDVLKSHLSYSTKKGDIVGDREKDWRSFLVTEIMRTAKFISIDSTINIAVKLMDEENSTTLVVDNKGNYIILTTTDIIRYYLLSQEIGGFNVNVTNAPDDNIKDHAIRKALGIMNSYKGWLGENCTTKIRFKRNMSQSKGGQFSTKTMIRVTSGRGHIYSVESTDFGAEKSVNDALDKISRVISDEKQRSVDIRDQKSTIRYLSDFSSP